MHIPRRAVLLEPQPKCNGSSSNMRTPFGIRVTHRSGKYEDKDGGTETPSNDMQIRANLEWQARIASPPIHFPIAFSACIPPLPPSLLAQSHAQEQVCSSVAMTLPVMHWKGRTGSHNTQHAEANSECMLIAPCSWWLPKVACKPKHESHQPTADLG